MRMIFGMGIKMYSGKCEGVVVEMDDGEMGGVGLWLFPNRVGDVGARSWVCSNRRGCVLRLCAVFKSAFLHYSQWLPSYQMIVRTTLCVYLNVFGKDRLEIFHYCPVGFFWFFFQNTNIRKKYTTSFCFLIIRFCKSSRFLQFTAHACWLKYKTANLDFTLSQQNDATSQA